MDRNPKSSNVVLLINNYNKQITRSLVDYSALLLETEVWGRMKTQRNTQFS